MRHVCPQGGREIKTFPLSIWISEKLMWRTTMVICRYFIIVLFFICIVLPNSHIHAFEKKGTVANHLQLNPNEQAWLNAHPEITVGVDGNWPPIDFVDKGSEHRGITADVLDLIAGRLNIKINRSPGPTFKEMLDKVITGELMAGATIAHNPKRAERLYLTEPFTEARTVIVARKGEGNIAHIKDLYRRKVAIEKGFVTQRLLQETHPEIELYEVADSLAALQAVSWGKADAYVGNQAVAHWLIQRGQLPNLQFAGLAGIPDQPQHIAVHKSPELLPLVGIFNGSSK